jgi:hypothetical protein
LFSGVFQCFPLVFGGDSSDEVEKDSSDFDGSIASKNRSDDDDDFSDDVSESESDMDFDDDSSDDGKKKKKKGKGKGIPKAAAKKAGGRSGKKKDDDDDDEGGKKKRSAVPRKRSKKDDADEDEPRKPKPKASPKPRAKAKAKTQDAPNIENRPLPDENCEQDDAGSDGTSPAMKSMPLGLGRGKLVSSVASLTGSHASLSASGRGLGGLKKLIPGASPLGGGGLKSISTLKSGSLGSLGRGKSMLGSPKAAPSTSVQSSPSPPDSLHELGEEDGDEAHEEEDVQGDVDGSHDGGEDSFTPKPRPPVGSPPKLASQSSYTKTLLHSPMKSPLSSLTSSVGGLKSLGMPRRGLGLVRSIPVGSSST